MGRRGNTARPASFGGVGQRLDLGFEVQYRLLRIIHLERRKRASAAVRAFASTGQFRLACLILMGRPTPEPDEGQGRVPRRADARDRTSLSFAVPSATFGRV